MHCLADAYLDPGQSRPRRPWTWSTITGQFRLSYCKITFFIFGMSGAVATLADHVAAFIARFGQKYVHIGHPNMAFTDELYHGIFAQR